MSESNQTILLVEDNEDDIFGFRWTLKKTNLSMPLQVVTDGQQALEYLSGTGIYADRIAYPLPFIIFLDLKLPYRSGHEVLEWIQTQPELENICVVILSGSDESRDHQRAATNGAQGYLVKPPSQASLMSLITTAAEGGNACVDASA